MQAKTTFFFADSNEEVLHNRETPYNLVSLLIPKNTNHRMTPCYSTFSHNRWTTENHQQGISCIFKLVWCIRSVLTLGCFICNNTRFFFLAKPLTMGEVNWVTDSFCTWVVFCEHVKTHAVSQSVCHYIHSDACLFVCVWSRASSIVDKAEVSNLEESEEISWGC